MACTVWLRILNKNTIFLWCSWYSFISLTFALFSRGTITPYLWKYLLPVGESRLKVKSSPGVKWKCKSNPYTEILPCGGWIQHAVSFYLLTWCLHSTKRPGTKKVCQTLVTIGNTCSFPYHKLEQVSAGPGTQATESR